MQWISSVQQTERPLAGIWMAPGSFRRHFSCFHVEQIIERCQNLMIVSGTMQKPTEDLWDFVFQSQFQIMIVIKSHDRQTDKQTTICKFQKRLLFQLPYKQNVLKQRTQFIAAYLAGNKLMPTDSLSTQSYTAACSLLSSSSSHHTKFQLALMKMQSSSSVQLSNRVRRHNDTFSVISRCGNLHWVLQWQSDM
jgi:translation initiation factor 2 beta subunit (eIF-2beta)/eIF-5